MSKNIQGGGFAPSRRKLPIQATDSTAIPPTRGVSRVQHRGIIYAEIASSTLLSLLLKNCIRLMFTMAKIFDATEGMY
jgi:hypothetical protein